MKQSIDQSLNICNFCENYIDYPECIPDEDWQLKYGCGYGNDNIISCSNYSGDETFLEDMPLNVYEFMKLTVVERRKLLAEQVNNPEIIAYYRDVVKDMHALEDKGMME